MQKAIESVIKSIQPFDWKNIPQPIIEATTGLLSSIDYLKRFALFLDSRFTNLNQAVNSTIYEMQN